MTNLATNDFFFSFPFWLLLLLRLAHVPFDSLSVESGEVQIGPMYFCTQPQRWRQPSLSLFLVSGGQFIPLSDHHED
ncbi:hypothetical protein K445DRAFT_321337 [Daldinia sp. EC12]|nr:hypothetical protein K445DRAFT_321337 [Daldinia sp. EC12]